MMGFDFGGDSDRERLQVLGQLAGAVAHEINNWLFVIRGSSELARLDLPAGDPVTENFDRIEEAVDLAEALTRMMLECAHPSGDGVIAAQLQPLVKEAVKLTREKIPAGVQVHQAVAADVAPVELEPVRVFLAVMALLGWASARIATGEGLLWVELAEIAADNDAENSAVRLTVGSAAYSDRSEVERWLHPDPSDVVSLTIDDDVIASITKTFGEFRGRVDVKKIADSGSCVEIVFPIALFSALR